MTTLGLPHYNGQVGSLLWQVPDALVIDTIYMLIDEQVDEVVRLALSRVMAQKNM